MATEQNDYDHVATIEQMLAAFRNFLLLSAAISVEDVERARDAISKAQAIGFVIDPTKYRDALQSGSLERQAAIVDLFRHTRGKLVAIFPNDGVLLGLTGGQS